MDTNSESEKALVMNRREGAEADRFAFRGHSSIRFLNWRSPARSISSGSTRQFAEELHGSRNGHSASGS